MMTRNEFLRFGVAMMAYFNKVGEMGDPAEANRILGGPTTTLDDWLAQQSAQVRIARKECPMHAPEWYEIHIRGQLSESRAAWFEGLTLRVETPGETVLSGRLDQSALHGGGIKGRPKRRGRCAGDYLLLSAIS